MKIEQAVELVASKFVYTPDSISIFDSWSIMREKNGHFYGDCDNFALTCIWYACDRSIWKFFLYVFILHKYRLWFCITNDGGKHVIGYAQSKFFDNFSCRALDKSIFFEQTQHKRKFIYPSPIILIYMIIGIFV